MLPVPGWECGKQQLLSPSITDGGSHWQGNQYSTRAGQISRIPDRWLVTQREGAKYQQSTEYDSRFRAQDWRYFRAGMKYFIERCFQSRLHDAWKLQIKVELSVHLRLIHQFYPSSKWSDWFDSTVN